jgi:adenylyltransferase/sulfurtransferase
LGKPFVSGSAVGMEGQITVISPKQTACFRCLYPSPSIAEMCRSCANAGVLGPVPGMIGCWEAIETLKLIVLKGQDGNISLSNLFGRQLLFDCANSECYGFDLPPRDLSCAICGNSPSITTLKDTENTLSQYRNLAEQEAKCYLGGELDAAQTMVADTYSTHYIQKEKKHLILDVRSKVQFGMSSFGILDCVCPASSLTQAAETDFSKYTAAVVNLPLHQLRAELSSNSVEFIESLSKVCKQNSEELDVIVVCRRGIDSVVATRLLHEAGVRSAFNLTGGLSAWSKEVDPNFPMY